MEKMKWDNNLSVGIKLIDNQHKNIIKTISKLYNSVKKNEKIENEKIIEEVYMLFKVHFETEEKYFKEFNYAGSSEHIKEHKKLLKELKSLISKNKKFGDIIQIQLVDFLIKIFVYHVQELDQEYKECFLSHNLK